ncbi:hypothetical protein PCNPT3_04835 [Psychromonas sp. CNPT3]|uniref:hypothetical protein n=1 Tax=Psychromonas sp. CNPT3 TaxID=314282 RepID=UPI00006E9E38|nr:hypothetical protein [Psychromonas sp. CNPT3]AGH80909.1 hypothetical protein PCNPT3_04835 [Psychromonas sp. CNPT3]
MKQKTFVFILCLMPSLALADESKHLKKLGSNSTDLKQQAQTQSESSRIYLKEGAIWASRDISRFDPVLSLSVSDEVEVKQGKLLNPLSFNLDTNFSYYIHHWQLEIYRGNDRHLSEPLVIQRGDSLSNSSNIDWDGQSKVKDYAFKRGEQLLFRLKVWDKDNNMDITTLGVIDLVNGDKQVSIDKNTNDEDAGQHYGKAQLKRHNIPTSSGLIKFIGSGLKGVESVHIGDDEFDVEDNKLYAELFLPTDSYRFPTTVIFKDGSKRRFSLYARIPETYYAQAGLADLYIGKNFVSSDNSALSVDDQYTDNIYNQGRLAYFGLGKFGDKLRIITHIDTQESNIKDMFNGLFSAQDTRSVFDIVDGDDEMMYGNYGDNANIKKWVNTQGKLYLNVQYDKSEMLWGNYNTGITGTDNADYNRSLYGFKTDYRTRETTEFGADRLNIVGFAANSETLYSHEEFLGTGGSLYFLKHGEVVTGSDKVSVKLMDKDTGFVEKEITLQAGSDYTIDAYQGRIILTKPLSDIVNEAFSSIINDDPRDGYSNYLAVDYEYVPKGTESTENATYGGRVKGWVNDNIGLGASYISEQKDNQDHQLYSTDLTLRATEGSYFKAEVAHSEGSQTDSNFVSYDGGLSFSQVGSASTQERSGNILQLVGVASLYDLNPNWFGAIGNDIKAWYKTKDAGYSSASQNDDVEQTSYGAQLRLQVSDDIQLSTRLSKLQEKELDGTLKTDTSSAEIEGAWMLNDNIQVSIAGKNITELNAENESGNGSLAGAKFEYLWDNDNSLYLKGQKTLHSNENYEQNDSLTLGGEVQIFDDLSLSAAYTDGDRGDATDASLTYDVTRNYSTYVTYLNDSAEQQNNVTLGQRVTLTQTLDFYQENQFTRERNGKGQLDSFGFDYDLNDDVDMGIAYQQGEIDYNDDPQNSITGVVFRQAISFNISIDLDTVSLKHKIEYRRDDAQATNEKIEQWVTTNSYTHHLSDEYTLFAKFDYSKAVNSIENALLERFIESSIGLAYRPIYNDNLNFLARYTYLVDFDNLYRDVDYSDEKSHIIETEAIYSMDAHWDFGVKYAYKDKFEAYQRASNASFYVNSQIYLVGLSASYRIMKDWDISTEYHWKGDTLNEELEQGALISFNKYISANFKVGVGYNFSAFDDNLTNDDDYDAQGVFLNLIGKI